MANILVVEDNQDIRYNLVDFLEAKNHITDNTDDGLKALALLSMQKFDLIILDVMLPGMDGLKLCHEIRTRGDETPVLFLSAMDTTLDRINGFDQGADDYLVKPFSLKELEMRINAILRRVKKTPSHMLVIDDLVMNIDEMTVFRSDQRIRLNPMVFRILKLLMIKSPSVVSRRDLEHELWGDELPDSDSLRTHMHNLRLAVDVPFEKSLIHTVSRVGWVLRA